VSASTCVCIASWFESTSGAWLEESTVEWSGSLTAWLDAPSAEWSSTVVEAWLVSIELGVLAWVLGSGVEMTDPVWDVAPTLAAVEPVVSMT
jgi:hypothetical protein